MISQCYSSNLAATPPNGLPELPLSPLTVAQPLMTWSVPCSAASLHPTVTTPHAAAPPPLMTSSFPHLATFLHPTPTTSYDLICPSFGCLAASYHHHPSTNCLTNPHHALSHGYLATCYGPVQDRWPIVSPDSLWVYANITTYIQDLYPPVTSICRSGMPKDQNSKEHSTKTNSAR